MHDTTPVISDDVAFSVRWKGPKGGKYVIFDHDGNRVMRGADGHPLPTEMLKEEAYRQMGNLIHARKAAVAEAA